MRNLVTDLIQRLRKRAEIRRSIPNRKSVQNNEPDRIANLLDEAANKIEELEEALAQKQLSLERQMEATDYWMKKANYKL